MVIKVEIEFKSGESIKIDNPTSNEVYWIEQFVKYNDDVISFKVIKK